MKTKDFPQSALSLEEGYQIEADEYIVPPTLGYLSGALGGIALAMRLDGDK